MKKVEDFMNKEINNSHSRKNIEKSLPTRKKFDHRQLESNFTKKSCLINPDDNETEPDDNKPESDDKAKVIIPDRLISYPELRKIHGLSRTTIWRLENENMHPRRRQVSSNSVRWLLSEVLAFINELPVVETRQDD
jgi:predicted DNA-binding transcriptional regulator AlpA